MDHWEDRSLAGVDDRVRHPGCRERLLHPPDPDRLHWQPAPEAAAATAAYVAGLFNGPGDAVEYVDYEFYDQVTFIDAGENTDRITCSLCAGDIDMEWFHDLIEENGESFVGIPSA